MPLTIACDKCGKKYQVPDQLAGKQVRCQQCAATFTVAAPLQMALEELDPLADVTLSSLPAAANPLGAAAGAASPSHGKQSAGGNVSGGPTDPVMRGVSCGLAAAGLVMLVGNFMLDRTMGQIYILPLILAPLGLILGIAGVISPNVVRAAGKYGGHLSWHYKAIAAALLVLSLVASGLLVLGFYAAGYFQA